MVYSLEYKDLAMLRDKACEAGIEFSSILLIAKRKDDESWEIQFVTDMEYTLPTVSEQANAENYTIGCFATEQGSYIMVDGERVIAEMHTYTASNFNDAVCCDIRLQKGYEDKQDVVGKFMEFVTYLNDSAVCITLPKRGTKAITDILSLHGFSRVLEDMWRLDTRWNCGYTKCPFRQSEDYCACTADLWSNAVRG